MGVKNIIKFCAIILLIFSSSTSYGALPVTFQQWYVDAGEGFIFASTNNTSGDLFGQYCYAADKGCFYLIAFNTECKQGEQYSSLVNTDIGASIHLISCGGKVEGTNLYKYMFSDFEDIDKITKSASKIGFAVPLQGDQFQVIRFSLEGAFNAINFMRSITTRSNPKDNTKSKTTNANQVL